MKGREIYEIWAPRGAMWVNWARPVPFIALDSSKNRSIINLTLPQINYVGEVKRDTAIVLDLPDYEAVKEGLALAKLGFRPVPLYNGTDAKVGAMSVVNNINIENALILGAKELLNINVPNNAPPAFLLDSNRTLRYKMNVSVFDNSWDIYTQDMPSAGYLLQNGINKIIVRGEKVQRDLNIILYKYQIKGIKIYLSNLFEEPKEITLKKPSRKHVKMS